MATKNNNQQNKIADKAKKQKKRQLKNKKHLTLSQRRIHADIEDKVDDAMQLIESGQHQQGLDALNQLQSKHPANAYIYYGLATYYDCKGANEEAIDYYKKSVQLQPDFIEAHFNMGVAYKSLLDISGMIVAFRQVLKYSTFKDKMWRTANDMLKNMESNAQEDGLNLDQYLQQQRVFDKGVQCMEANNLNEAIVHFQEVIEKNNKHTQSYANLGICHVGLDKIELARQYFEKSLQIDPGYEVASANLAMLKPHRARKALAGPLKILKKILPL
ncbi:MAG: tetratricopeptide repeat protein [Pseudomonadales bacterium]|nr:tetratricopeptide repeat protein [Pseudomonadales bacterium]